MLFSGSFYPFLTLCPIAFQPVQNGSCFKKDCKDRKLSIVSKYGFQNFSFLCTGGFFQHRLPKNKAENLPAKSFTLSILPNLRCVYRNALSVHDGPEILLFSCEIFARKAVLLSLPSSLKMRYYHAFILLLTILIGLFLADLSFGSVSIPFLEIVKILRGGHSSPQWENIVWDFRMTKALTCILTGAALSISGLQMQTLFRNALAGPDVLGLTSGASLAVSLVFMGQTAGIPILMDGSSWTVAIAASIGCAIVFTLMFSLAGRLRENVSLLIVGLMVGAGTSSLVSILQYLSTAEELQVYLIWTFGSLGTLSWQEIKILSIVFFAGAAVSFLTVKSLNAWLLGDNYARSLGINTRRARIATLFAASLLTGGVTAFCGPIAFVGLAVPHLVKMLIKTHDHKILFPAVTIGGAILVLFCDIVAQLPGGTQVLPINAITALIGAPVVVWVILRNRIVQ